MPVIELYGHSTNTDHLVELVQARRERQKALGLDFLDLPQTRDCRYCGRSLGFTLGNQGQLALVSQWPSVDEFQKGLRQELPAAEPCPVVKGAPIRVPFTCKSGRVALGNDFRPFFEGRPGFDSDYNVCNIAGQKAWIEHLANFGYLLGSVGNTTVHFVPRDGGLDVVELREPEMVGSDQTGYRPSRSKSARAVRADEKAAVHKIHTELWWFAIVDAADLPEGVTDTYDRPLGFMEFEPGEYEMVYHTYPWGFAQSRPPRVVWAEIRPKGSNSDRST